MVWNFGGKLSFSLSLCVFRISQNPRETPLKPRRSKSIPPPLSTICLVFALLISMVIATSTSPTSFLRASLTLTPLRKHMRNSSMFFLPLFMTKTTRVLQWLIRLVITITGMI